MGIRVRAKRISPDGEERVIGYYDLRRIREGQEFVIKDKQAFSSRWMEWIGETDEEPHYVGKENAEDVTIHKEDPAKKRGPGRPRASEACP